MQNQAMPVVKSICVEEYLYHDREGRLVAKKQRWEPGFHGRKKDFTWRRPVPFDLRHQLGIPNADQCWANNLGAGDYLPMRTGEGIILVKKDQPQTGTAFLDGQPMLWLYRLGDLLKSTVQQSVFVVEGERKADRLAALGFVAVSGHAGAGKWEPANAADFKGRKVIIIPDRDGSTGADEYGWRVAGSAMLFGSESVRMVMIEPKELGPNLRGDIVDWLGLHGGRNPRQSVIDLCKRYPEYRGAELPHLKAAA